MTRATTWLPDIPYPQDLDVQGLREALSRLAPLSHPQRPRGLLDFPALPYTEASYDFVRFYQKDIETILQALQVRDDWIERLRDEAEKALEMEEELRILRNKCEELGA